MTGNKRAIFLLVMLAFSCLVTGVSAAPIHTIFTHSELEWRTITTDHFRIHFDAKLEKTARYAAVVIERAYARLRPMVGYTLSERYDIILRDTEDVANGLTDPTDGTITIWITPMDFNLRGNHRWLQNVLYHELTHMLHMRQADPSIIGARKLVGPLLTIPNAMSPIWFSEGLAQYAAEYGTENWDSYRRMVLRAAVLDDGLLSYDKMSVFGKDAHEYELAYNQGYALVRYIAATYGEEALGRIIYEKGNNFTDFDEALTSSLGMPGEQLYDSWVETLHTEAETWGARVPLTVPELRVDRGWNDLNGIASADGRYLAFSSNDRYDYQRQLLFLRDREATWRRDQVIAEDINNGIDMLPSGEAILFTRNEEDGYGSSYSDLFLWKQGEIKRVTRGARVFYPSFFPGGDRAVAVQHRQGRPALVVIELAGGAITTLCTGEYEEQYFHPRVSPDGRTILFSRFFEGNRDLYLYDLERGTLEPFPLTTAWQEEAGDWVASGDIVFSADYEGVYDIFRYRHGQLYRLTRTTGGYFEPRIAAGEVYCSSYGAAGYDIVSFALATAEMEPYISPPAPAPDPGEALAPDTSPAEPYRNRFRSPYRLPWLSYDGSQLVTGLAASAHDALNRHIVTLQATYNYSSHNPYGGFQYINRVWYPTLIIEGFSQRRSYDDLLPGKTADAVKLDDYSEQWRRLSVQALVPITDELSFTLGGLYERVSSREEIDYLADRPAEPYEGKMTSYQLGMRYSDLVPTSDVDIGITSGYVYEFTFGHQVKALQGNFDYETYQASAEHYFPMPWRHNTLGLKLAGGWCNGWTPLQGAFRLGGSNGLRGYGTNVYRGRKMVLGTAEYIFPLWYDIARSTGSFYFDGLYLSLFGDWGRAWDGAWEWDELHAGYGGALTLKASVYYSFPYHISIGAAKGLDDSEDFRLYIGMGSLF